MKHSFHDDTTINSICIMEPVLTGRKIALEYTEKQKETQISKVKETYPVYYDYENEKEVVGIFPYSKLLSFGILTNETPKLEEKIVLQTNLMWLYFKYFNFFEAERIQKELSSKSHSNTKEVSNIKDDEEEKIEIYEKGDLCEKEEINEKNCSGFDFFIKKMLEPNNFDEKSFALYSTFQFGLILECARNRVKEISLFDLFNGNLRYNTSSINPKELIISFTSFPISFQTIKQNFSTVIQKHNLLDSYHLFSIQGSNPGFDASIVLPFKISTCTNSKKLEESKSKKANQLRDNEALFTLQFKFESIDKLSKSYENFEKIQESKKNTDKELDKSEFSGKNFLIYNTLKKTKFEYLKQAKTSSLSFVGDEQIPIDVYVITDNVGAFGPTLSFNNVGLCLNDRKTLFEKTEKEIKPLEILGCGEYKPSFFSLYTSEEVKEYCKNQNLNVLRTDGKQAKPKKKDCIHAIIEHLRSSETNDQIFKNQFSSDKPIKKRKLEESEEDD